MNQQLQPQQGEHRQQPSSSPQQTFQKPCVHVQPVSERQTFGVILASLALVWDLIGAIRKLQIILRLATNARHNYMLFIAAFSFKLIMSVSFGYFDARIIFDKEYLAGKPSAKKFWSHWVSIGCILMFSFIFIAVGGSKISYYVVILELLLTLAYIAVSYFVYSQDDFGGSSCLCLKPFVTSKPVVVFMYPDYGFPTVNPAIYPAVGQPMGYPAFNQQVHPSPRQV